MSTGVFKNSISATLIWGISRSFPLLSPSQGQISYILLTRPPLSSDRSQILVRLACMKHAASVRPEPGSNSPLSESLCPSPLLLKAARLRFIYASFRYRIFCLESFFEINKLYLLTIITYCSHSFSAILFSMFYLICRHQRCQFIQLLGYRGI